MEYTLRTALTRILLYTKAAGRAGWITRRFTRRLRFTTRFTTRFNRIE